MALFIIGGVACELHPFNVNRVSDESEMPFARHRPIGDRTVHEKMALHDRTLELRGNIYPRKIGGEKELALIRGLHEAGKAVLIIRGKEKLGWYVIPSLRCNHTYLDERGVGRKVDIEIKLELAKKPDVASAQNILVEIYGYAG